MKRTNSCESRPKTMVFYKGKIMEKQIKSKKCFHCQEIKPISEFGKNRSMKDGYQGNCNICRKIFDSAYNNSGSSSWNNARFY